MPPKHVPQPPRRWQLRWADQGVVGGLVLFFLVALVFRWSWLGLGARRLIDIDDAPPLTVEFRVDINEAGWPEFSQLPEIGETLARRIVESREADGPFQDHDDLRRVRGIGPKTLEQIRPYLGPLSGTGTAAR